MRRVPFHSETVMAEKDSDSSDSDVEVIVPVAPPAKRRRIIDPAAIVSVPVYSNKVSSSLKLEPLVFTHTESPEEAEEEHNLWPQTPKSKRDKKGETICLSSEEEEEKEEESAKEQSCIRSPSPPSPPQRLPARTRRSNRKMREINRRLNAIGSLLSPQQEVRRAAISDDDDDIIIVSSPRTEALDSDSPREIVLKFRSRTDLFKIPIQSTSPLSEAVEQLSLKLQVPPSRILLLRKEVELPVDATATKLGLGITDIIDCVVITEEEDRQTDAGADADTITIRLQGQERGSGEDFTLHKDAPLGLVLKQYVSRLALGQRQSVRFLFDGSKVNESHTPSQLEMEDGDVIEVWA
ncbi:NFATC2-interacting protein [Amia ocellicauda]|uniref:NFATC2-interacting protein n=1 Tax=Amia ocellicauda TaxID=2972642 RepID=UPI003464C3E2